LVRKEAIVHLAAYGSRDSAKVVPVLIEHLKEGEPWNRRDAARALAEMGHSARSAVPALRQALNDPDEDVRKLAEEALGKVTPQEREAQERKPD